MLGFDVSYLRDLTVIKIMPNLVLGIVSDKGITSSAGKTLLCTVMTRFVSDWHSIG